MGLARGERIAQCEHIKLVTDRSFPVQIDGGKIQGMCSQGVSGVVQKEEVGKGGCQCVYIGENLRTIV